MYDEQSSSLKDFAKSKEIQKTKTEIFLTYVIAAARLTVRMNEPRHTLYKLDHTHPTILFHMPKPCPSVVLLVTLGRIDRTFFGMRARYPSQ